MKNIKQIALLLVLAAFAVFNPDGGQSSRIVSPASQSFTHQFEFRVGTKFYAGNGLHDDPILTLKSSGSGYEMQKFEKAVRLVICQ